MKDKNNSVKLGTTQYSINNHNEFGIRNDTSTITGTLGNSNTNISISDDIVLRGGISKIGATFDLPTIGTTSNSNAQNISLFDDDSLIMQNFNHPASITIAANVEVNSIYSLTQSINISIMENKRLTLKEKVQNIGIIKISKGASIYINDTEIITNIEDKEITMTNKELNEKLNEHFSSSFDINHDFHNHNHNTQDDCTELVGEESPEQTS